MALEPSYYIFTDLLQLHSESCLRNLGNYKLIGYCCISIKLCDGYSMTNSLAQITFV